MQTLASESFSIPTLTFALSAVYLGSALLSLLLHLFHRSFPGAKLWILGQCLLATGGVCVTAQSMGLDYDVLVIANTALFAGILVMGHSIWLFKHRKSFPLWSYAIIPLSAILWFALGDAPIGLRVLVYSGSMGILAGAISLGIVRNPGKEFKGISAYTTIYFACLSLVGIIRAISAVLSRVPISIAQSGSMGSLEYLMALFVAFFNLFGYFLLSSVNVEHDLMAREVELRHRNEELTEIVKTKDALIAVLGHDLRAPVWSATKYVRGHLVDFKGDLNTKRESIETLAEGLERISGLLDSLLEWALCASGRTKLQAEPVHVDEVLAEAIADMAPIASEKGVRLAFPEIYTARGFLTIRADRRALATVFRNLLSNAIKYSRKGSDIRLSMERTHKNGREENLTICIDDHGTGMKPDQLNKLFIPGLTLLTLGTGGEQGKGFGLAICKLFVEAMGGSINVASTYGVGTRFELVFPLLDSA
ncbi:MAG: HAMP domain-containing sensor histidine kinase [Spirochaetia bacterium]|nr:HAMP domain-containing sensor histidine kinase [Spirochaetia bacterium]